MIYIELNGRIGNHLFQIATAASFAKKHGVDYKVVCHDGYKLAPPDNCYVKDYIEQFRGNILRNIPIQVGRPTTDCFYYYDIDYVYKEIPFEGRDMLLYGAFQSEKYFDKPLVKELFSIPADIKEYIYSKFGTILDQGVTSINVRRGDYTKLPHRYAVCSMSYFNKAIDYLGRDKKYLIISDDIDWCKKHFKGENFFFVDDEEPIIDLYIQTLCTNNIISNSTFSWWGAWLNPNPDNVVVCPNPWFGKSYDNYDTKDLIPESWVQIENKLSWDLQILATYLITKEKIQSLMPKSLKERVKKILKNR